MPRWMDTSVCKVPGNRDLMMPAFKKTLYMYYSSNCICRVLCVSSNYFYLHFLLES